MPNRTGMFWGETGLADSKHSKMAEAARSATLPRPTHQCGSGTFPAARNSPDLGSQRLVWLTFRMPARMAAQLVAALKPTAVTIPDALMPKAGMCSLSPQQNSILEQFCQAGVTLLVPC